MRQQLGMILLTTMLMMVILALLTLSLMQGVYLYLKESNQIIANHDVTYQLEAVVKTLDLTNVSCMVLDKNPNQLVDDLSANHGCMFVEGARQFTYVFEDLGVYPCFQFLVGDKRYSSHHWLITLATMQPPHVLLQLRVAQPEKLAQCELSMVRLIHAGVMSWRRVN